MLRRVVARRAAAGPEGEGEEEEEEEEAARTQRPLLEEGECWMVWKCVWPWLCLMMALRR
jgi:hypothetical protein